MSDIENKQQGADQQSTDQQTAEQQNTEQQNPTSHYPQGHFPQDQNSRSGASTLLIILGIALIVVGAITILPGILGPLWFSVQSVIAFLVSLLWPVLLIVAGIFIIRLARKSSTNVEETPMGFNPTMPPKGTRLMRSSKDRIIAGVCGGIANYFGIDPTIVRIITVVLFLLPGVSWLIYILAWIIIPLDRNN